MNKQIITLFLILLAIVIIFVIVLKVAPKKASTSNIQTAQQLENLGKYEEAISLYCSGLISKTDGKVFPVIPEKTTAANLNPQTWQKPIAEILEWLNIWQKHSEDAISLIASIERCMPKAKYENILYDIKHKKLPLEQYTSVWLEQFCPEGSPPVGLIEKSFNNGVVIVNLDGNATYFYQIDCINKENNKRISFAINYDKKSPIYLTKGNYLFLIKSKTVFKHGFQAKQEWISNIEAFSFVIPDTVNFITAKLKTEPKRKK